MTYSEQEVQWIVAEVIRRLELAGVAVDGAADHGELRLNDMVITMRTIEGRLSGVRRVSVPAKAVITPAVRDELNDRNVALVRQ